MGTQIIHDNVQRLTKIRSALATVALIAGVLAAALVWSVASPYEITRMRNSLIASAGAPDNFTWIPSNYPQAFLRDSGPIPLPFMEAARKALSGAVGTAHPAFETALALARHLGTGPGRGEGVKTNTEEAYRSILTRRAGYCADYTQVFNGLANAANLPVREWGMSFENFGGNGHAFNEIFDETLGKWVFIDSYKSFFVRDSQTGEPLSAQEFREHLRRVGGENGIVVVPIDPARYAFRDEAGALRYYRRGADQMFLWFGNNVFAYDRQPLIAAAGKISRALEQGVAILLGYHPTIRIIPTDTNREIIGRLFLKRDMFFAGLALLGFLGVALIWLLVLDRRNNRPTDSKDTGAKTFTGQIPTM